ncbi:hypothetical protein MHB54_01810 [Paenibacillus sp. FSL M7-0802]|uniref:hypothetical protein n=1 Tax=Paenibacillus TaxID=44249 RepID=UPI000491F11E|nr:MULTISPECIES: hypothetical protein [Paenibacillus]OMF27451.1 hypothetical protein BK134_20650 [Paenibacillus peoriae]SFQ96102.1 hypothetical protein SAMN04488603_101126 [Paenibacillus sp. cl130]
MEELVRSIQKQVRIKKVACWAGLIMFGLCTLVGVAVQEWLMTLLALAMTILSVYGLSMMRGMTKFTKEYQPGKGYGYYRRTVQQKLRYLTWGQWLVGGLIVLMFFIFNVRLSAFLIAILGILTIQFSIKKRIKNHQEPDVTELEEFVRMGIVSPHEQTIGVYKDFLHLSHTFRGNQIVIVTDKRLISVFVEEQGRAVKTEMLLSGINKIRAIGTGFQGQGILLSVSNRDHNELHIHMVGKSIFFSPEQFIGSLLRALDAALKSRPYSTEEPFAVYQQTRISLHPSEQGLLHKPTTA